MEIEMKTKFKQRRKGQDFSYLRRVTKAEKLRENWLSVKEPLSM